MSGRSGGAVLAVDIGGSKIQVGIVNDRGEVLCQARRETLGEKYSRELILRKTLEAAEELKSRPGYTEPSILGASLPGPCDPFEGVLMGNVNTGLGLWRYGRELGELFGLPVFGDNDVNACAIAERLFGGCGDVDHYLWVTVSSGCGGALFLDGKLYRGARYLAGEVGHIPVEFANPRRCGCGVLGDLEIEGAGFAIGRKYLERKGKPPDPAFTSREVGKLARAGDEIARDIFRQSGYYVGRVCAMAQNLLNLQRAVIGGGVAVYDFGLLEPGIAQALDDCVFPLSREGFTVVRTSLGYDAALKGAAAMALIRA